MLLFVTSRKFLDISLQRVFMSSRLQHAAFTKITSFLESKVAYLHSLCVTASFILGCGPVLRVSGSFILKGQTASASQELPIIYGIWKFITVITRARSAHSVYLCVLCGSQNKQRLFPYTALNDWFVSPRRSVFTARYGLNVIIPVAFWTVTLKHDTRS